MRYFFEYIKSKIIDSKFIDLSDEQLEWNREVKEYNFHIKNPGKIIDQRFGWLDLQITVHFFRAELNLFEYYQYKKNWRQSRRDANFSVIR